ncbi:uncharacterized protein SCHCODRAFT_02494358 [Schizophyllum commune H4-8]|uniref:Expressed protein n=1 Tax=Schizophyllum commune (strain H4-8 / FGSC 9210) TaxID=578458 RepID=D8Q1A7_SCHCM|nr:uncharacterized protein SCHCODRAFT_02494358 [Schizophyllum commune H4-8]KAI5895338.1 hypothetical protein SCHCODRAFT_02494358 [Schizophyllum commune H4-8]
MSPGHLICAAAHRVDHLPPLLLLRSVEQALCPHRPALHSSKRHLGRRAPQGRLLHPACLPQVQLRTRARWRHRQAWRSRPQNRGRLGGRAVSPSDACPPSLRTLACRLRPRPRTKPRRGPASTAHGVGSCASRGLMTPTHELVMFISNLSIEGLCLSAVSSG